MAFLLLLAGCARPDEYLEEAEALCEGIARLPRVERCLLAGNSAERFYAIDFEWEGCEVPPEPGSSLDEVREHPCVIPLFNVVRASAMLATGVNGPVFIALWDDSYLLLSKTAALECVEAGMNAQATLQGEVTEDSGQSLATLFLQSGNQAFEECVVRAAYGQRVVLSPEQVAQLETPLVAR